MFQKLPLTELCGYSYLDVLAPNSKFEAQNCAKKITLLPYSRVIH